MITFLSLAILMILSTCFVRFYIRVATKAGLLDHQNERSSHKVPTPRGGGIVFAGLWLTSITVAWEWFNLGDKIAMALIPPTLICAIVGFLDDILQLSAKLRLVCHVLAGICAVIAVTHWGSAAEANIFLLTSPVALSLVVLGFAWSVNFYNFMDGLDGLAAVEAVFIFGAGGVLLNQHGAPDLAWTAWLLSAAVAGFLVWNRPKALVFMGDVGSGFLGAALAAFALAAQVYYRMPIMLWVMLSGLFWFDASITLGIRLAAGEKVYEAHRKHAYQRLHHTANWTHGRVLRHATILNLLIGCITFAAAQYADYTPWLFLGELGLLAGCYVAASKVKLCPKSTT